MKNIQIIIFSLALLCLFYPLSIKAQEADSPLSVTLISFTTAFDSLNDEVDIQWETGSEPDVRGFNIYRSTSREATGTKINDSRIDNTGNASIGDSYSYTDVPPASDRYYYKLAEVLDNGNENLFETTTDDKHVDVVLSTDPIADTESISGDGWYHFNEGLDDGDALGDGHKVVVEIVNGDNGSLTVTQTNQEPNNAPGADVAPYQWDVSGDILSEVRISFYYNEDDITGFDENSDYIGIAQYNANSETWSWRGGTVDDMNHKVTLQSVYATGKFALYRRIFGDANGDGYVDAIDLQRFGDVWNQASSSEFSDGTDSRFFNFNKSTNGGNQIIDAADLQVFGDTWNNGGNY